MNDETPPHRPRNGISGEVLKRFDELDARLLPFMVDVQAKLSALPRMESALDRHGERMDRLEDEVIRLEGRTTSLENRPLPLVGREAYQAILSRLDANDTERHALQTRMADPDPKRYLTHDELVVLRQKLDWWQRYRTELITTLGVISTLGFLLISIYVNFLRHVTVP